MLVWIVEPAIITPSGYGIYGGDLIEVDMPSSNLSTSTLAPGVTFAPTLTSGSLSTSLDEIYGYGLRDLNSESYSFSEATLSPLIPVYQSNLLKGYATSMNFALSTISIVDGKATITEPAGGDVAISYALRYDEIDTTTAYKGEASPGSLDSAAVWRIAKLLFGADGDVTITWAGGTSDFDKIWNNRAALSYS